MDSPTQQEETAMHTVHPSLILALACVVSGGCASSNFSRPDTSAEQVARDRQECVRSAPSRSSAGSISGNVYASVMLGSEVNACMRARGYKEE